MTRNQAIRRHRILWRWLAENPEASKSQWPGWELNGGKYEETDADCFLCEFAQRCGDCPLEWPGGRCLSPGSPFVKRDKRGTTKKERANLAKQIAELPIRRKAKAGAYYVKRRNR